MANCMIANVPPAVRQAGQTSIMRRQPTCAATSQNGTMSEKIGNWRPTIALSWCRSSPVSGAIVTSGMPSDPNATGAVLPISASLAASSGLKPSPIIIPPLIATGAPKPAAPSMKAPNANASISAWMRRSREMPAICCCRTSNWPVSTESW